ncbi:MAG: hypothetical protein MJ232_04465 [archaeon]|nr:hypothetical protein [archaeon]
MQLLWFYVAIVLAISDLIHSNLVWNTIKDFYVIFMGGLLKNSLDSIFQTWIVHEILEAFFHFIILSIVFLSFKIGFLAGLIHFLLDVTHSLAIEHLDWVPHRALHFVVESCFFIALFGL